jgi:mannose-6-phosphate isomerase
MGFELPAGVPVGETWELVDRADENSVVAEGMRPGATLRALMEEHGAAILGSAPAARSGRFPLLVKYIDATDDLSVQVHPDEESAARIGAGAEAKTEAWYVLAAAEGAALYCGLRRDVRAEEFAAIAAGPEVVDALVRWEVRPGDCVLVPGGTVHAIGRGVTLIEVQQNSDTTYRLWDWGRVGLDGRPRATHVEEALACVRFEDEPRAPVACPWEAGAVGRRAPLVRSESFEITPLEVRSGTTLPVGGRFRVLAVLSGAGRIAGAGAPPRDLRRGDVWLVPAACESVVIEPEGGALRLLQLA